MRRFNGEDGAAVLDLVSADLLPGQPTITAAMLEQALQADAGLEGGGCEVLVSADGAILGAVCYTVRATDGAGMLQWLHCVEDEQSVAETLIAHTLARLGRRTVHAFAGSTLLMPIGLPVGKRPGTRRALEACGFSGTGQWRYLYHRLDALSPRLYAIAELVEHFDGAGWQFYLRKRDGTRIGEARISGPVDGSVVLEWVALPSEHWDQGRILLEQCLTSLADRGIHHVTTCLEAPAGDLPYPDPAVYLHEAAGFTVIDQLHTYTRRP
ncbi:hypothetical protein AB0N17_46660 [Streptomyces sp. NPDC051133]|uniref:hypothetical protein n=1 Tax=Streptomyces sp. NPDC051133 TaxID=3155521 RepID=UPI003414802E